MGSTIGYMAIATMLILFLLLVGVYLLIKMIVIVDQYERGIVLTLGVYSYTLQPGLKLVIPIVQRVIKVDIRINTTDIPKQEVITKDNLPVNINAVVYFQVLRPEDAILKVMDFSYAITQYAQTALRDVIGGVTLDELLTERQKLSEEIQKIVDGETIEWGVDVTAIKLQDIELPQDMKLVMAKQAQAERERRSVIIRAEGELTASENLAKAMEVLTASGAISLRSLQTIETAAVAQSNTIVFAIPIEIMDGLKKITSLVK